MWYVYILKDKNNKTYIGSTNNLERRIAEHKEGLCYSTKYFKGICLEAYIAVNSESIARNLGKYFKKGSGKAFLKKRILTDEALLR